MKAFFKKLWAWVIAHKLVSGIICGVVVAILAVSISVPLAVNASKKNKTFNEPTYAWSEDYSKCTATRVNSYDSSKVEEETVNSVYSVVTSATCLGEGSGKYVATFTNSAFASQEKTIVLNPLDHSFGEVTYTWNDDHSQCTATRVCTRDSKHVETETVNSTLEYEEEPSYEHDYNGTYSAEFTNPAFAKQEYEETFDMLTNLIFTLHVTYYSVKYDADAVTDTVKIPSTYQGKPVSELDDVGFTGAMDKYNVRKVIIPSSITSITSGAPFQSNQFIEEVVGVPDMDQYTFSNCNNLKKIVFADSFTTITSNLFKGCFVEEIEVPGVTTIQNHGFDNSRLKKVTLGKNLNEIGRFLTFDYAPYVEEYIVDPECTKYASYDGVIYQVSDPNNKKLVAFPTNKQVEHYHLVEGTTSLQEDLFTGCRGIKEITINSSITNLYGEYFYGSRSIERINIEGKLVNYSSLGLAFAECYGLKEVVLAEENDSYVCENGLFMNAARTKVHFILGGYDQEITIPATVTEISTDARRACACPSFVVEEGSTSYSAENGVLYNKAKDQLIAYPSIANKTKIEHGDIANTVTKLGHYSFAGLKGVEEIDISDLSLTVINMGTFGNTSDLKKVYIPGGSVKISNFVFTKATALEELHFPGTLDQFKDAIISNQWKQNAPGNAKLYYNSDANYIYFSSISK